MPGARMRNMAERQRGALHRVASASPPRDRRDELQHAFGNHAVAAAVRDGLATPGEPLDAALRREAERRHGIDFGPVRIHRGAEAADAASRVDARAFTVGHDIVFARDAYTPQSDEGRRLVAHELAHVVQQEGMAAAIPTRLSESNDAAERAADAVAAGAPATLHRGAASADVLHRTPARQVSCAPGPLTLGDGSQVADPVAEITAAENLANEWLDNVIAELDATITAIRGGAVIGFPTISDGLAGAMRLVGLDPDARATWTGSGERTAALVLRRFRLIRPVIGGGGIFYFCLGTNRATIGPCRSPVGNICEGATATSCPGSFFIAFCEPWWHAAPQWRARSLLHEHFHNFAAFFTHTGRLGNIMCYERLAQIVSNVPLQFQRTDYCPDV
jgi:uncharacterized protein DUF4157